MLTSKRKMKQKLESQTIDCKCISCLVVSFSHRYRLSKLLQELLCRCWSSCNVERLAMRWKWNSKPRKGKKTNKSNNDSRFAVVWMLDLSLVFLWIFSWLRFPKTFSHFYNLNHSSAFSCLRHADSRGYISVCLW